MLLAFARPQKCINGKNRLSPAALDKYQQLLLHMASGSVAQRMHDLCFTIFYEGLLHAMYTNKCILTRSEPIASPR